MALIPLSTEARLRDPTKLGARCHQCPLARDGKPVSPVFASIPKRPVGVVVLEAPSKDDATAGKALSGNVGSAFNDVLVQARLRREDLIVIPAVCCTPPTKKDWKHLQKAVDACAGAFNKQVEQHANLPVLALGQWALYAWTGRRKAIDKARGFVRDVKLRQMNDAGRDETVPSKADTSLDESGELDETGDDGSA